MEPRKYLYYLALKYKGDWNKIYEDIQTKVELSEEEVKELSYDIKSKYITCLDDEYPECLKRTPKAPFVLFYHGDISLLSDDKQKIAIVGSRAYSDYGEQVTTDFASKLARDFIIVSGMAIGIDGIAHRSAINAGGKTIAVLGSGINVCYPQSNMDIYEACKERFLVISEYPDKTPPCPLKFPIRNRIIAGLCDNLLVTEGKINSGTQITAYLMLQKCGNICCVPTKIGENSICNHLIAEGAFLVETIEDIYFACGMVSKKPIFE